MSIDLDPTKSPKRSVPLMRVFSRMVGGGSQMGHSKATEINAKASTGPFGDGIPTEKSIEEAKRLYAEQNGHEFEVMHNAMTHPSGPRAAEAAEKLDPGREPDARDEQIDETLQDIHQTLGPRRTGE